MSDIRKDFEEWLDSDAKPCLEARSKYYTAQEQILGFLAYQAGRAHDVDGLIEKMVDAAYLHSIDVPDAIDIIRKHFGKE